MQTNSASYQPISFHQRLACGQKCSTSFQKSMFQHVPCPFLANACDFKLVCKSGVQQNVCSVYSVDVVWKYCEQQTHDCDQEIIFIAFTKEIIFQCTLVFYLEPTVNNRRKETIEFHKIILVLHLIIAGSLYPQNPESIVFHQKSQFYRFSLDWLLK